MTSPIRSILAATDFSELGTRAIRYAHALARETGASLCVIHVCEDPTLAAPWLDGYAPMIPEWREHWEQRARQQLLQVCQSLEGVRIATDVVQHASPAHGIVDYAIRGGHDLIVVGTHGSRGITHAVLGSVAERVVRTADCPVLTVRAIPSVNRPETADSSSELGRPWLASLSG
jgi:nucleotide-binding universal stress UspA family protein